MKSSSDPTLKLFIPFLVCFVNPISSASSRSRNFVAEMWMINPFSLLERQIEISIINEFSRHTLCRCYHLKHGSFRMSNCAPPSDFFLRILSIIQCSVSLYTFLSNSITIKDWREGCEKLNKHSFRAIAIWCRNVDLGNWIWKVSVERDNDLW